MSDIVLIKGKKYAFKIGDNEIVATYTGIYLYNKDVIFKEGKTYYQIPKTKVLREVNYEKL